METSELTLLDLQNFLDNLKGYVRSEVEKYVDEKAKEIKDKDKAATYITNKPKKVRVAGNQYGGAQNKEVIKALFIGEILVWNRPESGQKYEIKVKGVEEFVDNKTGKVIEAKSLSGVCKALVGGGSYSGWEELEVCLNPKEGLQLLKCHRKKFFLDKNKS
ncbi:hypothetical protein [Wolbachia endosymbiont (group A) of Pogonocherus hispidulus]|uniref:hypothetical protein n=1 Tax=Wolbachia endosymbiont (group A) of Pogonocherus hispidulus TaxID=3066136 RepID=UPI00333F07FD